MNSEDRFWSLFLVLVVSAILGVIFLIESYALQNNKNMAENGLQECVNPVNQSTVWKKDCTK
jgi:hypothetical protein